MRRRLRWRRLAPGARLRSSPAGFLEPRVRSANDTRVCRLCTLAAPNACRSTVSSAACRGGVRDTTGELLGQAPPPPTGWVVAARRDAAADRLVDARGRPWAGR